MPRTRKAAAEATLVAEAAQEAAPAITLAAEQAPASEAGGEPAAAREPQRPAREGDSGKPAYAADPNEKINASLSDIPGGPEMQLLRSHKFKQEFKAVANAIRKDKGLGPVLEGLGA
jgi:hypothetical protein